jgi:hypothetical protein
MGVAAPPALSGPGPDRRPGLFHLGSSTIRLVDDGERRAVVLGVASLETSRAVLCSVLLLPERDGIAWLDPSATSGLAVGLVEIVHRLVPDSPGQG